MGVPEIVAEIDREIAQLERARLVLAGENTLPSAKRAGEAAGKKPRRKKHKLTPEGRKRIAEAVRRRWAAQKKAANQK